MVAMYFNLSLHLNYQIWEPCISGGYSSKSFWMVFAPSSACSLPQCFGFAGNFPLQSRSFLLFPGRSLQWTIWAFLWLTSQIFASFERWITSFIAFSPKRLVPPYRVLGLSGALQNCCIIFPPQKILQAQPYCGSIEGNK